MQLVKLLRAGDEVKMSKRSGEFVTLREVVDEVGRDAVRFMMLYRKNDAVLDFDLAKVIEQSKDNPVFYVQYGHARGHSVFRNAAEALPGLPAEPRPRARPFVAGAARRGSTTPAELALMRKLALYPRLVEAAALAHEPHRVAFYLYELASEFHAQWTRGNDAPHLRFIIQDDPQLTVARLALVQGVVTVLASGLALARGGGARGDAVARSSWTVSPMPGTVRRAAAEAIPEPDSNGGRQQRSLPIERSVGPRAGAAAPASDPLAELARLIGQNDPFADYGRETQAAARPTGARRQQRSGAAR